MLQSLFNTSLLAFFDRIGAEYIFIYLGFRLLVDFFLFLLLLEIDQKVSKK